MPEVIRVVGGDPNDAVRRERAMHGDKESFADETTRSVAALWPRIGKHEMKHGNGIRWQEPLDCVGNLGLQNAGVHQTGALDLSTSCANAASQTLDSEETCFRLLRRDTSEKRTIAGTQVDLEGGLAAENCRKVEKLATIRRDELDFACYGWSRIGGHVR